VDGPEGEDAPDAGTLAERRLLRARETLETYRESTKYPPDSRPMRENPDQLRPHSVSDVKYGLRTREHRTTDAKVTVRQDRLFLVGEETAKLSLRCENSDGPVACEVLAAAARADDHPLFSLEPRGPHVDFSDDGDGWLSATFSPRAAGMGARHGMIHIDVVVRIGGEEGATGFLLQYTPQAPATFTGVVKDVVENGSLVFRTGITVKKPGRYVITARVDDADGKSFALLSFNDLLPAGPGDVPLRVFGKLLRDIAPKQPVKLRDVEGFLLLEDSTPDRALMPMLSGVVHTAAVHPDKVFSTDEWQSEERSRHLTEFEKDAKERALEAQKERGEEPTAPAASR
jgi:hypothetical protein